ncbi:MAG: hypothetical protein WCF92_04055 [bacterium]
MKKDTWEQKSLKIKDLSLWDENARFPEEYFKKTEDELIEFFLHKKEFKIETFAKEIAKDFDLPQLERLVVLKINNRMVVLEGNRRLTVYKLIANPKLVKNSNLKKLFEDIQKQTKINESFTLDSCVTTLKEEGLRIVDRKHNQGNNEVGWGELERRNFTIRRSSGKSKDVLRVELANFVKELSLPDVLKESVLGKGLVTTFYRIVDSVPARERLGYEVLETGKIKIKNRKIFDSLLKTIVYNVWEKKDFKGKRIDSRSLNKFEAIEAYIKGLQPKDTLKVDKEIKKETKKNLFGEEVILSPFHIRSKELSVMRKFLINSSIYIENPRINEIYNELKKRLEVDNTPNAVAVLFRVFIECSVDCYIEKNNLKIKDDVKLAGKILKTVEHLEEVLALKNLSEDGIKSPTKEEFKKAKEKVKFKNMRKVATKDNGSVLSVETFHSFVHDYKTSPIPSELKKHWDNLDSFFIGLWDVLSKKTK